MLGLTLTLRYIIVNDDIVCLILSACWLMPNPQPVQSELFKQRRLQRVTTDNSCIPAGTPLAEKILGVRLPVAVDAAIRKMGKEKAAWLREVICQAALDQDIVEEIGEEEEGKRKKERERG